MKGVIANRKILVSVMIMTVVVFLWYNLLYTRQKKELLKLDQEISKVESLVSRWVSDTRSLSDYNSKHLVLKEKQHQLLERIPKADQVQELAERIVDLGSTHQCQVTYIGIPFSSLFSDRARGDETIQGQLMVVPLQVNVKGQFISIGNLMESLSKLPFFSSFGDLEITRLAGGNGDLVSSFSMVVYVLRSTSQVGEAS
jgi:Tfp pilus assembly protein PilO